MARLSDEEKRINEELLKQARIRSEIGNTVESFLAKVKELKEINETIKYNEKLIADLKSKQVNLSGEELRINKAKIKVLKHQTDEIAKQGEFLRENLQTVNKSNLALSRMASETVKGMAKLPKIVQNSFGKFRAYGLFDMDKAIKMSSLQMGLLGEEANKFSDTMRRVGTDTNALGVGVEELAKIQATFTDNLGRNVMLSDKALKSMAAMSVVTGLGAEGTAQMASDFDSFGVSAEKTRDLIEESMNSSHKMGLNANKVIKNMQGGLKLMNRYNFKDGVKGLEKMAKLVTKLGIDMDFAAGMADKLWDIEGAVDMSAQLQVLGGAWSKLADPFKLMYMARNDMEGLTEEIGKAAASSMKFAKDGSIQMSSMEMSRLKLIAQQTGADYDKLVESGRQVFKNETVKKQLSFNVGPEMQEFIAATAQFDEKGQATITLDGKDKLVSQLTELDKTALAKMTQEKKSLEERAKTSQNFDDKITNMINMIKTTMLPIVDGINNTLSPLVDDIMNNKEFKDSLYNLGKSIGGLIVATKPFFTTVKDIITTLGPGGTLTAILGGKVLFNVASWVANGLALGRGFLTMTKGFGGGGSGSAATTSGKGGGMFGKMGKIGRMGVGAGGGLLAGGIDAINAESVEEGVGNVAGGVIGGIIGSFAGPLGTVIGAQLGSMAGGYLGKQFDDSAITPMTQGEPLSDGYLPAPKLSGNFSKGRQLVQDGVAHPIDNVDKEMWIGKSGGPLDRGNKTYRNADIPQTINHTFDPIEIKGSIMINVPGNPGQGVELLRNQEFIRSLTPLIHQQTQISLNQKTKG
jgi:hypothetical protein